MCEERDVPELRFEGFDEEWAKKEFGELLSANDGIRRGPFGSALKKEYFVDGGPYGVYEQQNAIYKNTKLRYFINQEKYNELHSFSLNSGDIIMSGAGTIGRVFAIPEGHQPGVFNQALIRMRTTDNINQQFFVEFLESDEMQKNLTQSNPGSAITNLLPMSELKKMKVFIPEDEREQGDIGEFISKLKNNISLRADELTKLKNFKQAMLQKMFPKEGEREPEVRFGGFIGEWEEYIFSDVANILTGLTYSPSDIVEKGNPDAVRVLRSSNINDYQFVLSDDDVYVHKDCVNIPVAKTGQILMTASNGSPKLIGKSAMINCDITPQVHGGFMYIIDSQYNNFINYWLLTGAFKSRLKQVQGGNGSIGNLKRDLVFNTKIKMPSKEEQQQIGRYFQTLDANIQSKQAELEKFKQFKQAMLSSLFV